MNKEEIQEKKERIWKEHFNLIVILVTIAGTFLWSRTESKQDYRELSAKIDGSNISLSARIDALAKDVTIIKTALIMKNILPMEVAVNEKKPCEKE